MGRTFGPADDRTPTAPIVVLSHAAWQAYFGGDPDILHRRLVLDGDSYDVIGVLAPGAFDRDDVKFWKPLALTPAQHPRGWHWLTVHGRLREGVTLQQARDQMCAIDGALVDVTPAYKREWTIAVERLETLLVGDSLRRSIIVAFGAVVVVLLIACANVANLLLARGATRRKEMAVRAALGASRGRLVGQLLIESLVLRVLAFSAAIASSMALLVGIVPSLQTASGSLSLALNRSGRGASAAIGHLRRAIVIGEVALSLVLACGAGLLFETLFNLQRLETGVRVESVITMTVDLPLHAHPTPASAAAFYESVSERLAAVPGVVRGAASSHLPLLGIGNGEALRVASRDEMINVRFKRVDAAYFDVLDIALRAGRGITARGRAGSRPVVVINEALATRLAADAGMKNPVGQVVQLGCGEGGRDDRRRDRRDRSQRARGLPRGILSRLSSMCRWRRCRAPTSTSSSARRWTLLRSCQAFAKP